MATGTPRARNSRQTAFPHDFSSLENPESVLAGCQDNTGNNTPHREAVLRMPLDVMQGAWVSDMLLDAGRGILSL
jgi:hypothetical protein